MQKNLIFIGMPAVGKSTVGVVVAKRLGMQFIDSDLLIQEREKRLLCEIISDVGREAFLQIENEVNQSIQTTNAVISPGGSIVYSEEAMNHFKEMGIIVYLKASYQTIRKRIRNPEERGVVLQKGQTLEDLYQERTTLFEKYADITVCEDGVSLEDTIERTISEINYYMQTILFDTQT
jgi:shikimate kinase